MDAPSVHWINDLDCLARGDREALGHKSPLGQSHRAADWEATGTGGRCGSTGGTTPTEQQEQGGQETEEQRAHDDPVFPGTCLRHSSTRRRVPLTCMLQLISYAGERVGTTLDGGLWCEAERVPSRERELQLEHAYRELQVLYLRVGLTSNSD
jgi:hypothetical protein